MSKVKIETLTSVHIGSGEFLHSESDFVKGSMEMDGEDYQVIGIVDLKKIMNQIGKEHIGEWVAAIERGKSTKEIVGKYSTKAQIEDYSKRIDILYADKLTDTLKEFIHDGMGRPYIPGSSIKGAIRTSILASLANNVNDIESKIKDFRGKVNAKQIEAEVFGKDPNADVFRFLQVGDAIFGNNYEQVVRMVNINERKKQSFWDESKHQLIEVIGPDDETTFWMNLKTETYDKIHRIDSKHAVKELPECMRDIRTLFKTVNNNTISLLKSEVDYWKEREDADENIGTYIKEVTKVINSAKKCKDGESCVLRIGHGSGWRFITGAWTEQLDNFDSVVITASRPKNDRYNDYSFPKSRRIDDGCELLGFVKLTVID